VFVKCTKWPAFAIRTTRAVGTPFSNAVRELYSERIEPVRIVGKTRQENQRAGIRFGGSTPIEDLQFDSRFHRDELDGMSGRVGRRLSGNMIEKKHQDDETAECGPSHRRQSTMQLPPPKCPSFAQAFFY
jgi:hypothetical protein